MSLPRDLRGAPDPSRYLSHSTRAALENKTNEDNQVPSTQNGIRIRVECADALTFQTDFLVVKYAQDLYGLDLSVVERLEREGIETRPHLPQTGSHHLVNSMNQIAAQSVLFVGVEVLFYFRYKEIRDFARRALAILAQEAPEAKHIAFTLHGANYGLDELEAFEAEVAGLSDAVKAGSYPPRLEEIIILERKQERAERLFRVVGDLFPGGSIGRFSQRPTGNGADDVDERLRSAGYTSETKPRIFVAMPFDDKMDDVYDYGIKGAVNDTGFICERADLSAFTGDIMNWVKERIRTSKLVFADLTGANPNVYLEVGYAWGAGVPTILAIQQPEELKFNVRGQRCLTYRKISELEEQLREELESLRSTISG